MKVQRQSRSTRELLLVDRTLEKTITRPASNKEFSETSENYHEDQLAEIRWLKELEKSRKAASGTAVLSRDIWQPAPQGARFCAYNRTRQRFLSNQVDICDADPNILEVRLASFVPGAGTALWVTPQGELPLTIFRFPVDLVYLDRNYAVHDTVESFPLSTSGPSKVFAASVLILTARTISSVGIKRGDQLILCGSEEMELFLSQPQSSGTQDATPPATVQSEAINFAIEAPAHENLPDKAGGDPPQARDQLLQTYEPERKSEEPAAPETEYPSVDAGFKESRKERQVQYSNKKSWWRRFLAGEPPDPRAADRETIPGLIAYFFTGGAPIVHRLRDISADGIYVFTRERWYPDTIIRITLSDEREPSNEMSLTVNARVARADDDGVGLQFVLTDKRNQTQNIPAMGRDLETVVTKEQLEAFVGRFKSSRS